MSFGVFWVYTAILMRRGRNGHSKREAPVDGMLSSQASRVKGGAAARQPFLRRASGQSLIGHEAP